MNGFSDLQATLQGMGFRQLLPAFGACTAYAMAQGRIVSVVARRWAWGAVVVCAAVFSALCRPWEHGIVLMAFGLAGMGLFTGMAWLISRLIGFRNVMPATAINPSADVIANEARLTTDIPLFDR